MTRRDGIDGCHRMKSRRFPDIVSLIPPFPPVLVEVKMAYPWTPNGSTSAHEPVDRLDVESRSIHDCFFLVRCAIAGDIQVVVVYVSTNSWL